MASFTRTLSSLAVATTAALIAATLVAQPAAAATCASGWSSNAAGNCQRTLSYNGSQPGNLPAVEGTAQYVTVPAGITSMTMVVAGASGSRSASASFTGSPAGKGGRQTATVPVVPGDTLTVIVGEQGSSVPQSPARGWQILDTVNNINVASGAFGGGGMPASNQGGYGGGGSFVFDGQASTTSSTGVGNLLVAAGGGGGGGYDYRVDGSYGTIAKVGANAGGNGSGVTGATSGASVAMTLDTSICAVPAGGGQAANQAAPGAGGHSTISAGCMFGQADGNPGMGPTTFPDPANPANWWLYLGSGGNGTVGGQSFQWGSGFAGAGGGGYNGGGAGGTIDGDLTGGGGGGGVGYVTPAGIAGLSETGVMAGDGSVTLSYTPPLSSDSTLSALKVSAGAISPVFAPATLAYTASVAYTVSSTTVTATRANSGATLAYQVGSTTGAWTALTSGTASAAINLPVGATTIYVRDTAQNGVAQSIYSVAITRAAAATDASLSALKLSAGALSPVFASTTTAYTAAELYTVSSVTVTATRTNSFATIAYQVGSTTGAWTALTSGTASAAIALPVGVTNIYVRGTAQDGVTTKTYSIAVTRAAASTDSTLSALKASAGTLSPVFASATTAYTVAEAYTVSSVTVTATRTNAYATLGYQVGSNAGTWTALTSGTASAAIALPVGATVVYVRVTAQDGSTRDYSLTFNRAAPSSVKTLSALKLSSGTLSPTFAAATLNHSTTLGSTVASVTVTATVTTGSGATLSYTVNGGTATPLTSGTASAAIAIPVGTTTIAVKVTAQDGTSQSYTIAVKK